MTAAGKRRHVFLAFHFAFSNRLLEPAGSPLAARRRGRRVSLVFDRGVGLLAVFLQNDTCGQYNFVRIDGPGIAIHKIPFNHPARAEDPAIRLVVRTAEAAATPASPSQTACAIGTWQA